MTAEDRRREIGIEAVKAILKELNRAHGMVMYTYVPMEQLSKGSAVLLPIIEIALLKAELEESRKEKK